MRPVIEELGSTPEDAIKTGLRKTGLSRDRVLVEIVTHHESTPPGMSKVRLTPLGETAGPLKIGDYCSKILAKMGIAAQITVHLDENRLVLTLESEASGRIIGRNGTTLDALQYLLNRIMQKIDKGTRSVVLDIEGYRKRKELNLIALAHQTAEEVKETGLSVLLTPMTPFDRRIIHLELEDDPMVSTHSIGRGMMKSVEILPASETHPNRL